MIVNRLPELLHEKRVTLYQLAQDTGINYRTLIRLVYSDFDAIHISVLDRLCRTLDVRLEELLYYLPGEVSYKPALERVPHRARADNKRLKKATVLEQCQPPHA